jgi:tetratricopeptide (TPR) repeat protein
MSRFLVAAALLLLRGAASAQENPERILQQAIRLHQAGDAEKAIVEYRAYLKARPDAVDARSNLGVALAQTGRYQEAAVEYREALKRRPRDPRIRLNLALAHYKLGRISEAAAELSTLQADQPGDTQTLLLLADCLLRQGLHRNVIDLLSPAADQHPENLAIAYLLGTALLRDNQIVRGQQFIDRILRNGDSGEARLLMGTAKLDAREYEAAIAEFEKAAELNPQLPGVHSYLGRAYIQTGDTAAARLAFQKELELNPNDFESNLNLGVLLKQDQDYEGAGKLLDRALLVRPGDPGARFQRASVNLEAGRFDQARAEFEAILRQAPQFVEAHIALATTYYRMKRKADGDREKATAQKLTAEQQAGRNKEDQE